VLEGRDSKDLLTLSTDLPSLTSDLFALLGSDDKADEGEVEFGAQEGGDEGMGEDAVAVGVEEDISADVAGSPINPNKPKNTPTQNAMEAPALLADIRERVAKLSRVQLTELLRLTTIFFHLVNSLEQHEIIRINRERAIRRGESGALPDSIEEAVLRLKELGFGYEEAAELFGHLDIQPTITAHPTEARRRSILNKQESITALIDRLALERLTPMERQTTMHRILSEILLLLSTDEVRPERLTVKDEVENGLFYFTGAIWSTIPRLYDEIEDAFLRHYGKAPAMPVVLKYRSWIGSDRDGNPNVTYQLTWSTFLEQQRAVLQMYHRD
jgi:Phosphoenolpyruvate carboxylase